MFHQLSWQTYWTTIITLSVIYYLTVYLLYFRKEIGIRNKRQVVRIPTDVKSPNLPVAESDEESTVEVMQAQSCLDEINAFFEAQKKSKVVKTELIYGLQGIAQKYFSLKNSPYRQALSNVMSTQSETICSIHLDVVELKEVWLD